MMRKSNDIYDQNLIDALKELPSEIEDKKHNLIICVSNDLARSNETRFEHIAKRYHELKVRDIKAIPEGIRKYVLFIKSKEIKNTYYYFIKRSGKSKGFIQVAIQVEANNIHRAYIKTIYITYRLKNK